MSRSQSRRDRTRPVDVAADAAGALVLVAAALSGFVGTFDGPWWVVTAAVGLVLGVLAALGLERARLPWFVLPPVLLVLAALLGPPLTLRGTAAGTSPSPAAWAALGDTLAGGWNRLLTTLPPLDGAGPLALIPFVLALTGGATAMLLARRHRAAYLPVLVPALVGAATALLGVLTPGGVLVRGGLLLVGGVVWGAARARRSVTTHAGARLERLTTAGLLLGVAGLVVAGSVPLLGENRRTVLREYVEPPFATTDRPSPLAAFRAFRPAAEDLADAELLRVSGLPEGGLVRLVTVDTYAGTVWAAGNATDTSPGASGGFLRVGARIPRSGGGDAEQVRVTVGPGWAQRRELRIWVPTLGGETRIAFQGPTAQDRADALRYNLDTGAAVLPGGLAAGESYVLDARPDAPPSVRPATPRVEPELTQPVARLVAAAQSGGGDPLSQVESVAARLRSTGAYSDGGEGEETILPGHSLGRLTSFVGDREPAGNDEQYAATLALAAAYVGMPARVVLGAVPGSDGVVRGADVRAYVEVHDGSAWLLLPPERFVPPRDRAPSPRSVAEQDRSRAAVVPPPQAQRPPSSEDGFSLDESVSGRSRTTAPDVAEPLPLWARVAIGAAAVPAVGLPLWTLLLVGAKAGRRAWRSRRGTPRARSAAAWDDVVGALRDAGYAVSARDTRREVARAVGGQAVLDTARVVDATTFGPVEPEATTVDRSWALARRARGELAAPASRRERWRRSVSLASLLPERTVSRLRSPSGIHAGRLVPARSAS